MPDDQNRKQEGATEWHQVYTGPPGEAEVEIVLFWEVDDDADLNLMTLANKIIPDLRRN